jgi:hypothetical protein
LIIANDIESGKIFGSELTHAYFVEKNKTDDLGKISKVELAKRLAKKLLSHPEPVEG